MRRFDILKATFSWKNAAAKSKVATSVDLMMIN